MMDKLGELKVQVEHFLRALAMDLGVEPGKGYWLVENFANDSVSFDAEFATPVPEEAFKSKLKRIAKAPIHTLGRSVASSP